VEGNLDDGTCQHLPEETKENYCKEPRDCQLPERESNQGHSYKEQNILAAKLIRAYSLKCFKRHANTRYLAVD